MRIQSHIQILANTKKVSQIEILLPSYIFAHSSSPTISMLSLNMRSVGKWGTGPRLSYEPQPGSVASEPTGNVWSWLGIVTGWTKLRERALVH